MVGRGVNWKFPCYNAGMKNIIIISIVLIMPVAVWAGRIHPERFYQEKWCLEQGGQSEYRLPDMTRCDCLTDEYAIEFDFANKWAEAVGQSLYYAMQTGKRAGIVLIIEKEADRKYLIRLNSTILHFRLPIRVWVVSP